ncbi:MAG TPA: OsmC family protein [Chitinophagaceae bacterium]|nr:OsmC family protein [Chitinophagaceae bacterium]
MKTTTTWKKKLEFESRQDHNSISLDGSKKHGFGPKALLLSGLAGCSGVDVVEILEKMRIEFDSFEMDTEATLTEEHPKIFKEVYITYKIRTDTANEDKIRKAIDLSLDKYCGVSAMLKKNSPIAYKLIIEPLT